MDNLQTIKKADRFAPGNPQDKKDDWRFRVEEKEEECSD